jgi:RNA polymerase sigma factor (sigma-70 family)
MNDSQLLRRYATDRSEDAFTELVRRHLSLVYHAALRQCGGDAHRAEDVAQTVFVALARKANALARRPTLAGWLYTSTRYAAAQAIRSEARRQAREREAYAMSAFSSEPEAVCDWERLCPVVDDALHSLGGRDREAILFRFFEGQAFAEIGAQLAMTDNAARMRVERALEKMRAALARRGVTSTAATLAGALSAQAATAVPTGVAASITGAALSATAVGGGIITMAFMSTTKLQAGIVFAVIAAGSAGLVLQHQTVARQRMEIVSLRKVAEENAQLRTENARLATSAAQLASGYTDPAKGGQKGDHPRASQVPGMPMAGEKLGIPLAPGLTPVESLGNAGRSTPRTAFATQLWAARTGNIDLEAEAIALKPNERATLQALMASLPPDLTSQYNTPEKLMAFALAGSPNPVGGMQVLAETVLGPDDVTLQTQWQHTDDTIVHQSNVQLHQDSDGWKMVVPTVLVDWAADYLSSGGFDASPSVK